MALQTTPINTTPTRNKGPLRGLLTVVFPQKGLIESFFPEFWGRVTSYNNMSLLIRQSAVCIENHFRKTNLKMELETHVSVGTNMPPVGKFKNICLKKFRKIMDLMELEHVPVEVN